MNNETRSTQKTPKLNQLIGTIGMLMITVSMAWNIVENGGMQGDVLITWLGFLLLINYIYKLEENTDTTKKFVWIRSGVIILTIIVAGFGFAFY